MTIVILSDFLDQEGGATSMAKLCARALANRDEDVVYIAGESGDATALSGIDVNITNLNMEDIRSLNKVLALFASVLRISTIFKTSKALRNFDPKTTIVILHQWTRVFSPSIFWSTRNYKAFVFAHDFFAVCPNGAFYIFPEKKVCTLQPLSAQCALKRCDRESRLHKMVRVVRSYAQLAMFGMMKDLHFIFVSSGQLTRYGQFFPPTARKHVLPNIPPHQAVRVEADVTRELLYVGRMVEEKGALELACAARQLGMKCTFVGSGELLKTLKVDFGEFEFIEWSSPAEVAAIMASSKIVVVPSHWPETSALVAFEALMAGVPVALSATICSSSELKETGAALVLEDTSPSGLASTLAELRNANTYRTLKEKATFYAQTNRQRLSSSAYGDRLIEILSA
jgi:glycosyltransferase involved in cell wall biosynthesis